MIEPWGRGAVRSRKLVVRTSGWGLYSITFVCLAAAALTRQANEPRLRLVASAEPGSACATGLVVVSPTANDGTTPSLSEGQARRTIDIPETIELSAPRGEWLVELHAEGCWSPRQRIVLRDETVELTFVLRRKTWISGRLAMGRGAAARGPLQVEVSRSFRTHGVGKLEGGYGRQICDVDAERFRCPVPVGAIDARIWIDGFAPVYRWDLETKQGQELDAGIVRLKQGSSLSGWIVAEDGRSFEETNLLVSASPQGFSDPQGEREQELSMFVAVEGSVDPDGFLQVAGLQEGAYLLSVNGDGYAAASTPIYVVDGKESVLRDPVVLRSPTRVSIVVDPPIAPDGRVWNLKIRRVNKYRAHFEDVLDVLLAPDGWLDTPLGPGTYYVNVSSQTGDAFADVELDTERAPQPFVVEIEAVLARGRLLLGEDPLVGVLHFGGARGRQRITAATDEEGGYEALLPRSGAWPVDVEVQVPPVKRRVFGVEVPDSSDGEPVRVDIELPDTRIFGKVLAPDGGPLARTPMVYARHGAWEASWLKPDENGDFDFRGLAEGVIHLHAMGSGGYSETHLIETRDGVENEVSLILEDWLTVSGRVLGPTGPLPGASVHLAPARNPQGFYPASTTDAEGYFTAPVPSGTGAVFATVSALGYTLTVERHVLREEEPVVVHLEREGATLLVELPDEMSRVGAESLPVYYRNGIPFPAAEVDKWGSLNPVEGTERHLLSVPRLAKGRYDVCTVPWEEALLWVQSGPRDRSLCRTAVLSTHSEQQLTLPALSTK